MILIWLAALAVCLTAFSVTMITVPSPPDLPPGRISPLRRRWRHPIHAVTRNVNDPRMGPATNL